MLGFKKSEISAKHVQSMFEFSFYNLCLTTLLFPFHVPTKICPF